MGINCLALDVRVLPTQPLFDAVCMFQVLEHMNEVHRVFGAIARLVPADAQLFIAVPNAPWVAANEAQGLLWDMPPNHIGRWSWRSFEALEFSTAWHIRAIEEEPVGITSDVKFAFLNRFIRKSQQAGTWANRMSRIAASSRSRRLSRAMKLAGAITDLGCWTAAVRRGGQ